MVFKEKFSFMGHQPLGRYFPPESLCSLGKQGFLLAFNVIRKFQVSTRNFRTKVFALFNVRYFVSVLSNNNNHYYYYCFRNNQ